jgi:hypothetical protein
LALKGFDIVTPERWQSLIDHVRVKVEDFYWEKDCLFEEEASEFIIHLSESDLESSSSSESEID